MKKTTFGVMVDGQDGVVFEGMGASLIEDSTHPNHPDHPGSPNAPRAVRHEGYPNPLLGDPGNGRIGRWHFLKMDALENIVDQMIEHYLRDKNWYSRVRCREALWNMYRRIKWWVDNQADPARNDYHRALIMIRDAIKAVLGDASNVTSGLPLCPAPYTYHSEVDYIEQFDGADVTNDIVLFSLADSPIHGGLPDLFNWVSATEDQEWELKSGALVMNLKKLTVGNATKVSCIWRVRKKGFIRFRHKANVEKGNGLVFFINGEQVSGEWSGEADWVDAKYALSEGQTYKFDWVVRKMKEPLQLINEISLKDIEVVESITFPSAWTGEWEHDGSSHIVAAMGGSGKDLSLVTTVNGEADGQVKIRFMTGQGTPPPVDNSMEIIPYGGNYTPGYEFISTVETDHSKVSLSKNEASEWWSPYGHAMTTEDEGAKLTFELHPKDAETSLILSGNVRVNSYPKTLDTYLEGTAHVDDLDWDIYGEMTWEISGSTLLLDTFEPGQAFALTSFDPPPGGGRGSITFSNKLKSSQHLTIYHMGIMISQTWDDASDTLSFDLIPGMPNDLAFVAYDDGSVPSDKEETTRTFDYSGGQGETFRVDTRLGSWFDVTRNWAVANGEATTSTVGEQIIYNVHLIPGATLSITEDRVMDGGRLTVKAVSNGVTVSSNSYTSSGQTALTLHNTTSADKDYVVTFELTTEGTATVSGGSVFIQQTIGQELSEIRVTISTDAMVPYYMGGDTSEATVTLYKGGTVISTQKVVDGSPLLLGNVLGFQDNSPYPMYKCVITFDQRGRVSPYTGIAYMASMTVDFPYTERYQPAPDPFSSRLRLFIDGVETSIYDTILPWTELVLPVGKGSHEYKLMFTSANEDNNWDFAVVDSFTVTNWFVEDVDVLPYCNAGGGDKCIDALITCLLKIIKERPKGVVVGKKAWILT